EDRSGWRRLRARRLRVRRAWAPRHEHPEDLGDDGPEGARLRAEVAQRWPVACVARAAEDDRSALPRLATRGRKSLARGRLSAAPCQGHARPLELAADVDVSEREDRGPSGEHASFRRQPLAL